MDGEERGVTNSPEHINKYIDGTIERLGFTPDLYYLHRIDPSLCPRPPCVLPGWLWHELTWIM